MLYRMTYRRFDKRRPGKSLSDTAEGALPTPRKMLQTTRLQLVVPGLFLDSLHLLIWSRRILLHANEANARNKMSL